MEVISIAKFFQNTNAYFFAMLTCMHIIFQLFENFQRFLTEFRHHELWTSITSTFDEVQKANRF